MSWCAVRAFLPHAEQTGASAEAAQRSAPRGRGNATALLLLRLRPSRAVGTHQLLSPVPRSSNRVTPQLGDTTAVPRALILAGTSEHHPILRGSATSTTGISWHMAFRRRRATKIPCKHMFYLSIYIKHVFKVKKPSTLSSVIQNIAVVRGAVNAELLQIPTA